MKTIIKNVKRKIVSFLNRNKWNKHYRSLVSGPRKSNFIIDEGWLKENKILMIVPHADDELISSYSVLCKADDLTLYYCGFTGSNNLEDNRVRRRSEIMRLCSEMSIKIVEGNGNCNNLKEVIREGNYDLILLPSIVDWHQEHRKISYMINSICNSLIIKPSIYTYSVTVPNETQEVVHCASLTEDKLNEKYKLFRNVYLSQKVMPIQRLKLNERINGFHAGCYSAETFSKYEFDNWAALVSHLELYERKDGSKLHLLADDLYNNLNNLVLVRQASSVFYKWIENEK